MLKVTLLDWVNDPENVSVFEGTEREIEIHLRSRFMKDTTQIKEGDLDSIFAVIRGKFGIHLEAWKRIA